MWRVRQGSASPGCSLRLSQARRRGFRLATGRGAELEQTRPFGLVAQALDCVRSSPDPRRAGIARLQSTHGKAAQGPITVTSDPGLQFRAVDAFVDLVEELALSAPLVIGPDDLQWRIRRACSPSGHSVVRLSYLPLALISCFRPAPRVPQLQRAVDALQAAGARRLRVRRLSERAVTAWWPRLWAPNRAQAALRDSRRRRRPARA